MVIYILAIIAQVQLSQGMIQYFKNIRSPRSAKVWYAI